MAAGAICREAGIPVLGGHSIDDPEPKFGMVAVGEVNPDRIVRLLGAIPGDVLVLTKAIGTGVISTALKANAVDQAGLGGCGGQHGDPEPRGCRKRCWPTACVPVLT